MRHRIDIRVLLFNKIITLFYLKYGFKGENHENTSSTF